MAGLRVHNGGLLFVQTFSMPWNTYAMESGPTIPWISFRDCGAGQGHHGSGFRWRDESPWTAKPSLWGSGHAEPFLSQVYWYLHCISLHCIFSYILYTLLYPYIIYFDTVYLILYRFCILVSLQISSRRNLVTTCIRRTRSDLANFAQCLQVNSFSMLSNDLGGSSAETGFEDGARCECPRLELIESLVCLFSNESSWLIWGRRFGRNRHWGKNLPLFICFVPEI